MVVSCLTVMMEVSGYLELSCCGQQVVLNITVGWLEHISPVTGVEGGIRSICCFGLFTNGR